MKTYPLMSYFFLFFFFNDTATTEIYTLSLHDALPISPRQRKEPPRTSHPSFRLARRNRSDVLPAVVRSEEHTSELQSQSNLVCRLLLEKKKKIKYYPFFLNKKKKQDQ